MDMRAVGAFDPKAVEGLSSLVASEAAARSYLQVFSSADIRALLGFDQQKQLLGCSEEGCLAEIGGALGVDYMLVSEASKVGSTWLLSFVLLDTTKARALNRLTRRTPSEAALVDATIEGVADLLSPLGPREGRPGSSRTELSATVEPAPRARWLTYSLLGAGAAGLAAGGVMVGLAYGVQSDYQAGQAAGGSPSVTRAQAANATRQSQLGWGVAAAGGAVVTWGLARWLWPSSTASSSVGTGMALAPAPSGGWGWVASWSVPLMP